MVNMLRPEAGGRVVVWFSKNLLCFRMALVEFQRYRSGRTSGEKAIWAISAMPPS